MFINAKLKNGFTLIELMVVLFIIGILSAVAIPMMRGRTDAAKWSEGRTMAGTIGTAIRALHSEKGFDWTGYSFVNTLSEIGFADGDLDGKYFKDEDFTFTITDGDPLTFTVTVRTNSATSPEAPKAPVRIEFNQDGVFTEYGS